MESRGGRGSYIMIPDSLKSWVWTDRGILLKDLLREYIVSMPFGKGSL